MNKYFREVAIALLLVTIFAGGTLYGASDAWAQDEGLAKQIQGSWTLVSNVNEQDGKKTDVFGPNPRGFMVLTPEGRFTMIFLRADLPKYAVNDRKKGTAEEYTTVGQWSIAFYGTYTVLSETEHTVRTNVEGSTFPNWDGKYQDRTMTVVGDELKMINPSPAIGGGKNFVIWKRAK